MKSDHVAVDVVAKGDHLTAKLADPIFNSARMAVASPPVQQNLQHDCKMGMVIVSAMEIKDTSAGRC